MFVTRPLPLLLVYKIIPVGQLSSPDRMYTFWKGRFFFFFFWFYAIAAMA